LSARLCADTGGQQTFDSNGVKIRYIVEGKGDPVLLIHGFTSSGDRNWRQPGVVDALAKNYQVITIDNRGHGLSEKPHDVSKYGEEMAEDMIRLLDHLGIKKAHVVGYSMGAMIAANLLTTHPERLLTVTLGGQGGVREGEDMNAIEALAQSLDSGKGFKPLLVFNNPKGKPLPSDAEIEAISKRMLAQNDPKALAAVCRSWKVLLVPVAKLKDNKVPALALIGELDPLKKGVDLLEGNVPNLKIVVIQGAGHLDAFRKELFVSELKSFLAAHPANAATNGANGVNGKFRRNTPAVPSPN
jgi:pimeloyl-ACP methyl ester carboxylesterase